MCPTSKSLPGHLKELPIRWQEFLLRQAETVMEGQTGDVVLRDGTVVSDVAFLGAKFISEVRGRDDIPFDPNDIAEIRLTHRKWRFW